MTEDRRGLDQLKIGKELEEAMESFLTNEDSINSGFVYSHEVGELPPKNVVVVLIHNEKIHKLLTDKLLELAQKAGLSVNSIEDFIGILHRKGFRLVAQNEEAQSYQRVRQILPPIGALQLQKT